MSKPNQSPGQSARKDKANANQWKQSVLYRAAQQLAVGHASGQRLVTFGVHDIHGEPVELKAQILASPDVPCFSVVVNDVLTGAHLCSSNPHGLDVLDKGATGLAEASLQAALFRACQLVAIAHATGQRVVAFMSPCPIRGELIELTAHLHASPIGPSFCIVINNAKTGAHLCNSEWQGLDEWDGEGEPADALIRGHNPWLDR